MGGNATKHVGTVRKPAAEYFAIATYVTSILRDLFPKRRIQPIEAYALKESFGDIDILIESDNLPPNWHQLVKDTFCPKAFINNGGVISLDIREMQVDLICTPLDEFEFASSYFAFNDLGNLMGRIAHKMGFKYGHDGFWKPMREQTHQFAEILVSRNVKDVMEFMGYDYSTYAKGFQTLEDVFVFAASTPYFSRAIFALDNRNHVSRIRDAKRPSYTAFLKWVEDKPELDKYPWSRYLGDIRMPTEESRAREAEKAFWAQTAFKVFDGFEHAFNHAIATNELRKKFKAVWNGFSVGTWAGMTEGKELGQFMQLCRVLYLGTASVTADLRSFEEFILSLSDQQRYAYVLECKAQWEKR